jgi:hypothetical protein
MTLVLSYSREDGQAAAELAADLAGADVGLSRDEPAVQGDAFWRHAVAARLDDAAGLLVLWSQHAAHSPWVDEEVRGFVGPVVVVRVDDAPLSPPVATAAAAICRRDDVVGALRRLDLPLPPAGERWTPRPDVVARRNLLLQAEQDHLSRLLAGGLRRAPQVDGTGGSSRNGLDGTLLERVDAGRPFYCTVAPVTNADFARFVERFGLEPSPPMTRAGFDAPDQPVAGVTWFEAVAYAAWVGGRLPTSAEWSAIARHGRPAAAYATATGALDADVACFARPLATGRPSRAQHHQPSRGGFFGVAGNTWDWCATAAGRHRVIAGGGYADGPAFCRVTSLYRAHPVDRDCAVGFRVVLQPRDGKVVSRRDDAQ